jgi:hypothetical protein
VVNFQVLYNIADADVEDVASSGLITFGKVKKLQRGQPTFSQFPVIGLIRVAAITDRSL